MDENCWYCEQKIKILGSCTNEFFDILILGDEERKHKECKH
jgi:hypothetical protein